jgi:DNA-binding transcriptional LysR family regulator
LNTHTIKCFLSVAKHLNFTRAAEEQFVAQSTITSQINAMEKEIGAKLFIRNKHYVKLTAAGECLKKELENVMSLYEKALLKAKQISIEEGSSLRVGYHGPVDWALLPDVLSRFYQDHPNIHIELQIAGWGELKEMLIKDSLDVIFIEKSEIENMPEIEQRLLFREFACLAVPVHHPLASKSSISAQDLDGVRVIMSNNQFAPISLSKIHYRLLRAGVDMKKATLVSKYESAIAMVASGLGVSPVPRSFRRFDNPKIVYIDFDSTEVYLDMSLAWRKGNLDSSIQVFIDTVSNHEWK